MKRTTTYHLYFSLRKSWHHAGDFNFQHIATKEIDALKEVGVDKFKLLRQTREVIDLLKADKQPE